MDAILSFAKNASPITISLVCIAGLVHIVILQLEGRGLIKKNGQNSQVNTALNVTEIAQLNKIEAKLEKIASNHLHGLPEMERMINETRLTLTRVENKVDKFGDQLVEVRERVARLE